MSKKLHVLVAAFGFSIGVLLAVLAPERVLGGGGPGPTPCPTTIFCGPVTNCNTGLLCNAALNCYCRLLRQPLACNCYP